MKRKIKTPLKFKIDLISPFNIVNINLESFRFQNDLARTSIYFVNNLILKLIANHTYFMILNVCEFIF